jgi:hypothetical protein
MTEKAKADFERHAVAQRRMQSGVALEEVDRAHKHLRVGVNTALVDQGSLARLLIAKGVITEEEFAAALADGMEAEVRRYEALLGANVKLGPAGDLPTGRDA